jgi:hypothetical protein
VDHRPAPRRRLVAPAAAALVLLLAGCSNDTEAFPHPGQYSGGYTDGSVVRTVLLYVGLPLLLSLVIYALAWLPGAARAYRYRPGSGWDAPPVWFAGPADPVTAVEQASVGDVVRGGAGGSW